MRTITFGKVKIGYIHPSYGTQHICKQCEGSIRCNELVIWDNINSYHIDCICKMSHTTGFCAVCEDFSRQTVSMVGYSIHKGCLESLLKYKNLLAPVKNTMSYILCPEMFDSSESYLYKIKARETMKKHKFLEAISSIHFTDIENYTLKLEDPVGVRGKEILIGSTLRCMNATDITARSFSHRDCLVKILASAVERRVLYLSSSKKRSIRRLAFLISGLLNKWENNSLIEAMYGLIVPAKLKWYKRVLMRDYTSEDIVKGLLHSSLAMRAVTKEVRNLR